MSITATRGSKSRRPLEFWSPLNRWWREYFSEHQRRPGTRDIDAWYADHADEAWPTDHKPTLKEARLHANCLRPVDEVKKYFRAYRKRKAGPSSPADDDTEGHAADELAVHACKQPRANTPEPQQPRPAAGHRPQMADQNATRAELPSFHSMNVLRAIPCSDPHPCLPAALLRATALPLHPSFHTAHPGFPNEQPAAAHSHSCTSLSTHSGLGNASSLSAGPLLKEEEDAAPTTVAAAAPAPLPRHSSSAGSSACTANAIGQNHTSRQIDTGIASYRHGYAPGRREPCACMDAALGARVSASGQGSPVPGPCMLEGRQGALGAGHRGLHGLPTCPEHMDQGRGAAKGALAKAPLQQGVGGVRRTEGEALIGGRGCALRLPEGCGGQQAWGLLDRALKQEPGLLASMAWHAGTSELQGLGGAVAVRSLQLLGHGRGQGGQRVQVYVDGEGRVLQGDGDALTILGQAPSAPCEAVAHPGPGPHGVASWAPKGGQISLGMQQGPPPRRGPGAPPSHLSPPVSRRASSTDVGERCGAAPPAPPHPSASDGPSLDLARGLPTRLSLAGSDTSRGLAPVHSTGRHSEPATACGAFSGLGTGTGLATGQRSPHHGGDTGAAQLSERTLTSIPAHVHLPPHLKSQLLARAEHSFYPGSRAGDVSPCSSDAALPPPAWNSGANLPTASAHGGLRADGRAAQQQLSLPLMLSGGATQQHTLQAYGLHHLPASLRTGLGLAGLLGAQNDGLGGVSASAHGLGAMLAPSPSLAPTTAMVCRVLTPEGLSAPVLLACPMQGMAGLMMGTQFMPLRSHHGSAAAAMLVHTL